MNNLRKRLILFGALLSAASPVLGAAKGSLPPIGQRIYILKPDGGKKPIAILRDKDGAPIGKKPGVKVLRDPLSTSIRKPPMRAVDFPSSHSKVAEVREKAGSLRFRKVIVSGAVSRPRIDFEQDPLPLERVDETVKGEFFQKIFIPARDDGP
jgi:hypothetical protein